MTDLETTEQKTKAPTALVVAWKQAEALSRSDFMPKEFRNKPANCFLALEIANRIGVGALEVAQNMYLVHGSPGWSATYMIARANSDGPFKGSLQFTTTGEGADMEVECWAIHAETGDRVSSKVSMASAKLAGWTSNPKYKEIPQQMLSYRAATFLVRLYCPEVLLGFRTSDELHDIAASEGARAVDAEVSDVRASLQASITKAEDEEVPEHVDDDERAGDIEKFFGLDNDEKPEDPA